DTLDPPLLVVTAADGAERAGCVVGFHSQCSLEPLRYALWLSTVNRTYRVALRSDYLGIHLLGVDDDGLGRWFGGHTGDEEDSFAGIGVDPGPGGVPLVRGVPGRFSARRVALLEADGDHARARVRSQSTGCSGRAASASSRSASRCPSKARRPAPVSDSHVLALPDSPRALVVCAYPASTRTLSCLDRTESATPSSSR